VFGKNRRAKFAAFGALVTLCFIIFQGVGDAHNPVISAEAECIVPTDQARITINVVSWDDPDPEHRTHNDVVLTVTAPGGYSQTFHNKFNADNDFGFTQTLQVPADGKTYTAVASTDQYWGSQGQIVIEIGPQSRSVQVTVPQPCLPATTTTTAPTTTAPTTTAPTTTAPATTAAPTTTVAPVSVQGAVETAPTTTVGTAVQGVVLARTGTNAKPLLLGGLLLVLLGTAVELSARRRRTA
jgi:hypothetical protein